MHGSVSSIDLVRDDGLVEIDLLRALLVEGS
jgi:hypothetical protein